MRVAPWKRAWVALLFVALLGQSLLVQSHVHAPAPRELAAASLVQAGDAGLETGSPRDPGKASHDCFACREAAAGGHYLLPPPVGWLGRAPPQ